VIVEAVRRLRRVTEFNTGRLWLLRWSRVHGTGRPARPRRLADRRPAGRKRVRRLVGYGLKLFAAGDEDEGKRWMNRARELPYGRMTRPRFRRPHLTAGSRTVRTGNGTGR
jgi:hypothetical protein